MIAPSDRPPGRRVAEPSIKASTVNDLSGTWQRPSNAWAPSNPSGSPEVDIVDLCRWRGHIRGSYNKLEQHEAIEEVVLTLATPNEVSLIPEPAA